ncbi:hypothetical protein CPB85DRAFT_132922 [Mucidula mucida]|nr:hypothetical protein CPB85DRAFT_132922 [Mucidula mucida]
MNSYEYLTQAAVLGKPAPPDVLIGLPVEIWLTILRHLVFSFPPRARLSVLFNLMTICHHWSNMIVNAASLWTSIVIEVSGLSSAAAPLMLNQALLALKRAAPSTLLLFCPAMSALL